MFVGIVAVNTKWSNVKFDSSMRLQPAVLASKVFKSEANGSKSWCTFWDVS